MRGRDVRAATITFRVAACLLLGGVLLWSLGQGWPTWRQLIGEQPPRYTALYFENPGTLNAHPSAAQPITWVAENRTGQQRSYRWTVILTTAGLPARTLQTAVATVPAGGRLTRVVRVDSTGPSGARTLTVRLDSGEQITALLGADREGS